MSHHKRFAALSDIHGDDHRMRELLVAADILDHDGNWIAEDTLLVFCGDYFDRGPNGIAVAQEVRRLQAIAPEGSDVEALIGNHDAMMIATAIHFRNGEKDMNWQDLYIFQRNGGDLNEAREVAADPDLLSWLQNLKPLHAEGDYLFQHVDGISFYRSLGAERAGENAATIHEALKPGLQTCLGAWTVFAHMTDERRFEGSSRDGLRKYLNFFGAQHVIHGHTPTSHPQPEVWMGGMAINIDGRMSVGYGNRPNRGFLWSVDLTEDKTSDPLTQLATALA
jgi:hypothetical protein